MVMKTGKRRCQTIFLKLLLLLFVELNRSSGVVVPLRKPWNWQIRNILRLIIVICLLDTCTL